MIIRYKERTTPDVTKAIAVESKFRESYQQDQGWFADCYVAPENEAIWEGLEPLRDLAVRIHGGEGNVFERLKVSQLIKHILGLNSEFHGTQNFKLIYLWYPAPGPEAVRHEDEINRFRQITRACNAPVNFSDQVPGPDPLLGTCARRHPRGIHRLSLGALLLNPPSADLPSPDAKRASQEGPLTGAYWIPRSRPDELAWDLVTCHDLAVRDGISHREFWPFVLDRLATAWGRDPAVLKRLLGDHYYGLPRGRITHPKSGYLLVYGRDAPVDGWLTIVKRKFRLKRVRPEFDDHERMLLEDLMAVEEALGAALGLHGFV